MSLIHRNLIVTYALAAAARELCAAVHPAGAGMFTVPLSPTGELPATHWASTGLLEDVWAPALEDPAMFFGAAQLGAHEQGLTLTATYADAHLVLIEGDISEEPWADALARLGLQLCHQEPAE
jgi:hypothetical protein